jgi:Phospholipase_D-nuclease N-terminal
MLLSGVLFVLFLAGGWLYCLADAILTPAEAFTGWRKRTWIAVIAATPIAGAVAWLIARRNRRPRQWSSYNAANVMIVDRTGDSVLWYPYAPTERAESAEPGPRGPDDDPEFLAQLAQRIHGTPTDPAE